jgi:hypothetical protein
MTTSLYSYTKKVGDSRIIPAEQFTSFLADPTYETTKLETTLLGEQFGYGLKPVLIPNTAKRTSEAQLRAIKNYRKNHREKYNVYQNSLYNKYKENPEWVENYNSSQQEHNTKWRKKDRLDRLIQLIDSGKVIDWNTAIENTTPKQRKENNDYLISRIGIMPKLTKGGKIAKPRGRPKKEGVKEL